MRKLLLLILGILTFLNLNAQNDTYYWAKNQKHYLAKGSTKEFILQDNFADHNQLLNEFEEQGIKSVIENNISQIRTNRSATKSHQYKWAIVEKSSEEHKPHPSRIMKHYQLKQIKEVLGL